MRISGSGKQGHHFEALLHVMKEKLREYALIRGVAILSQFDQLEGLKTDIFTMSI